MVYINSLIGFTVFLLVCKTRAFIPNQNAVRFTALGDWGGKATHPYTTVVEVAVAKAMGNVADMYQSQFTLALGDNFYEDGVLSVDDPRFQETFENVFTAKSLYNPWYVVAGNHDYNGNVQAQVEYTNRSKRWEFPSYYYNKRYNIPGSNATILFVMIDTIILCGNTQDDIPGAELSGPDDPVRAEEQWQWIEATLKKSTDDYVIVAGHFPVWSIAEHGPTPLLVNRLKPMLEKYRTTAYFSGHDHNLQYLKEDNSTVEYFVIGSAHVVDPSIEHKNSVPPGSLKFHYADTNSLGGFAYIEVSSTNATFTFVDAMSAKDIYQRVLYPRTK
ncbi:tartrate-resistant acid phosphatase type 5-like [Saccoglossus kowalevskii]|uniref:Tartrate-resistant acid phosphatase type 5 n=1 Tax=Saccoglossus kowalevskii TaxID=10224 RepID=A0ABM0LU72_SACKO|nr:PREDICTED: tartrate-resistant acid phosphatase type 5-like [Saccoglossus kowalevskii]